MIEKQRKLSQTNISDIQLDVNFRDEIPQLLMGIQAISD